MDGLLIPQFFQVIPQSLFTNGDKVLLSKEQLADGFTLKGKAYDIDFDAADDEIVKVDVASGRSVRGLTRWKPPTSGISRNISAISHRKAECASART